LASRAARLAIISGFGRKLLAGRDHGNDGLAEIGMRTPITADLITPSMASSCSSISWDEY
jgi:hypothetical protein